MDVCTKFPKVKDSTGLILAKLSNHLCLWCCARFIGVVDIEFYNLDKKKAQDTLLKVGDLTVGENVSVGIPDEQTCSTCFGILTHYTSESFLDKIVKAVRDSDIEFDHFNCSLGLPVPSVIREYAFLLICADVCQEAYEYMPLDQIPTVKEAWKWACGKRMDVRLEKSFDLGYLDILVEFEQDDIKSECEPLIDLFPEVFKKRKNTKWEVFTRKNVSDSILSVSRDKFRKILPYPPKKLYNVCKDTSIVCSHGPVYVAGRYNKYSRELSQSPWMIEGVRKGETSVAELIADPLVAACKADEYYFSSSGREDVDVRMLGSGRPFMIQLMNPHRLVSDKLSKVQSQINRSGEMIAVRDLQVVTREDTLTLKDLEAEKRKTYSAVCRSNEPITQELLDTLINAKDLVLQQKTPIRVLHRRPLATRPRTVHWMKAKLNPDSEHEFTLELETQAGTYVKEFVHSDFGRTTPCLSSFLNSKEIDILRLDVLSVHVDWPKTLSAL